MLALQRQTKSRYNPMLILAAPENMSNVQQIIKVNIFPISINGFIACEELKCTVSLCSGFHTPKKREHTRSFPRVIMEGKQERGKAISLHCSVWSEWSATAEEGNGEVEAEREGV